MAYVKALKAGLLMMAICTLSVAFPYVLLGVLYFLPGLIFGIAILNINDDQNKAWKNISFLVISTITYSICVSLIGLLSTDFRLLDPTKIVVASCAGSVVMAIAYQAFILNESSVIKVITCLLLVGLVSSTPSALLLYIFNQNHYVSQDSYYITKLMMSSIFIIFPLWQAMFVGVMKLRKPFYQFNDIPTDHLTNT
jgi:hypothetical protein